MTDDEEQRIFAIVNEPGATGDYDRVIFASDSLLKNVAMGDTLRSFIMIERLVAMANGGYNDRAMAFTDTLISFSKEAGIGQGVSQGLQFKGMYYRRANNTDSAIYFYNEALDLAIKDGDKEMEQCVCDLMATLYGEAQRWEEARSLSVRALDLAREIDDTTAMISASASLAATLSRLGNQKDVITTVRPLLGMSQYVHPLYRIKLLTPLFYAYIELDSIQQAQQTMEQLEEVGATIPERHPQSIIIKLAKTKLLQRQKRYAEQYELYKQLDTLGTIGRNPATDLAMRAECLANMGRDAEAYTMMTRAYEALDSVGQTDISNQLSDLSVRYDTLTKEMEMERIKRRHMVLIIAVLLCVMLLAVLLFVVISNRARYRRRLEKERREQYISGLEEERARMARDLHDDIAGQLVGLQWEIPQLERSEVTARVRDIGEQVRRLSHEMMLPQFSNQSLCQLLIDFVTNFNAHHTAPRITLTDEGSFDWDAMTPQQSYELYRIVQETVSNAVKHSEATRIDITLDGDEKFILSVENDGAPENASSKTPGAGSATLQARANILGAELDTYTADGIYRQTIRQK